jgi:uncharacterized protein
MQVSAQQLAQISDLCRRFHIQRLSLFGSRARGDARADSDVDVMLELEPDSPPTLFDLVHFQEALSGTFGGLPVDIAFPSILRNPYRRASIEPSLRILYQTR